VQRLTGANEPFLLNRQEAEPEAGVAERNERRVLTLTDTRVVVPIRRGDRLTAFLCLGEKRSGDVYTDTDLALLDRVAERVGVELERCARAAVEGDKREMVEAAARLHSCFLSYATEDERFARRLYRDLEAAGVRAWFAPESLRVGEHWQERLDSGLARAEKLIVVLSAHALASPWVGYEVEAALRRDATAPSERSMLFPLRLDDAVLAAEDGWPARIRDRVQIADFRGWEDPVRYGVALRRLVHEMRVATPRVETCT
jgi:hypothetical protein